MALSGTLQTLSLSEIFQTLERSKANGVLRLVAIDNARDVVLLDGQVVNVLSRDPNAQVNLERRMTAAGFLSGGNAIPHGNGSDSGLLVSLKESGVDEADFTEALQNQIMDELFDIFTWSQADFEFIESNTSDEEILEKIEQSQKLNIKINTNMVLMESARRLDEWERSKSVITSEHLILSAVSGKEQELNALGEDYPARAITPLINGIRSVQDIIDSSVATRLDVYLVLSNLIGDGLVLILDTDNIVANAKALEAQNHFDEAALLYRRAIASDPDRPELRVALAHALEQQGDGPRAGECYAELALGYLRDGDMNMACASAERAVDIGGGIFERNTLIQCLETANRIDESVEQMRRLAEHHVELFQWSEAKEVCHQILAIAASDEIAQHVISLAYIHTCDLDLKEQEVACVHCHQINDRNAIKCSNCSAKLHKLCRNCHSETACSDAICLFCGKNPHVLENERTASGLFDKLNDIEQEHRSQIARAVDLRDAGELEKALVIWKELAQETDNNRSIHTHIRELEAEIHNQSIEKLIAKGNSSRRGRAYARAVNAYSEALRIISPRDPRKPRLESILAATKVDRKRTLTVYSVAGVILLVTGWLAVQPLINYYFYEQDVRAAEAEFQSTVLSGGGMDAYAGISAKANELAARGASLGQKAKDVLVPAVIAAQDAARDKLSEGTISQIKDAITASNITKAQQTIAKFKATFGASYKNDQIDPLFKQIQEQIKQQKLTDQLLKDAPKLYENAQALLESNKLSEALMSFKTLINSPDQVIAQKSKTTFAELEQRQKLIEQKLNAIKGLAETNLKTAAAELKDAKTESVAWALTENWSQLDTRVNEKILRATKDFALIKSNKDPRKFEQFIAQYPGTDEVGQARAILNNIRNEAEAIQKAKDRITQFEQDQNWELLHRSMKRFIRDFGAESAQSLKFPLQIESQPSNADVVIDGNVVGKTPYLLRYDWAKDHDISIRVDNFDEEQLSLSNVKHQWKHSCNLNRKIEHTIQTKGNVVRLVPAKNHVLSINNAGFYFLGPKAIDKTVPVGNLGMLTDNLKRWSLFTFINDELLMLPVSDSAIKIMDHDGEIMQQLALTDGVASRPLAYVNELFGSDLRLGVADRVLRVAELGSDLKAINSDHQVISGPVLFDDGIEQLLVFGSHTGQFVAYDESSNKTVWEMDSGAADIGLLQEIAPNEYICTLDDSRLAKFSFSKDGLNKLWERPLPKAVIDQPFITDGQIYLTLRDRVLVYNAKGTKIQDLEIAEGVSCAGASALSGIAVADQKQAVHFYDSSGKHLWSRNLDAIPSALLVVEKRIYVGTTNGQVHIMSP